jgi:hypothetical protein
MFLTKNQSWMELDLFYRNVGKLFKGLEMKKRVIPVFSFLGLLISLGSMALAADGVSAYQQNDLVNFQEEVLPIFQARCVQCHACYNSPCQVNLASVDGIKRGLIQDYHVYAPKKLRALAPTRLGIDGKTEQDWRDIGFVSILPQGETKEERLESSFIYQMTSHKAQNSDLMVDDLNDFKNAQAEFSRTCPKSTKEIKEHLAKRPEAGMPYGLPALNNEELEIIKTWTEQGAPLAAKEMKVPTAEIQSKKTIENFFNRYLELDDIEMAKKESLVNRYIYEHLYLAHVYIDDRGQDTVFYRLVRSRTQCGANGETDEIATRRPWNDTNEKFFYCLKALNETIVHKTHITYHLDTTKVNRWLNLFYADDWKVNGSTFPSWGSAKASYFKTANMGSMDGYDGVEEIEADIAPRDDYHASNPFLVFHDIPAKARYQFMLDDSKFIVTTFIRGPVCKSNTATNSIDEQFYTLFVEPDSDLMVKNKWFEKNAIPLLNLVAEKGSEQVLFARSILFGKRVRKNRNKYRELRDNYFGREFENGYSINDIWNGNNELDKVRYGSNNAPVNQNALLTIFRNNDSAAVVQGAVGATSKTVFVLDYALLERLVYLLTAGFDVFGDINHTVHTRIYMSYLRMEAEELFLNFLPSEWRQIMRKSWYIEGDGITEKIGAVVNSVLLRGKDKVARRYPLIGEDRPSQITAPKFDENLFFSAYSPTQQEEALRAVRQSFMSQVFDHLGPATGYSNSLNPDKPMDSQVTMSDIGTINSVSDFEMALSELSDRRAAQNPWVLKLPSLSYLVLKSPEGEKLYTLVRNKAHFNVAWIGGEDGRRNKLADTMTFYHGVLGSYANHMFVLNIKDATAFIADMLKVDSEESYLDWISMYGTPRHGLGSERFWANSDLLHNVFRQTDPLNSGVIDFNRYGLDYRYSKDGNEPDSLFSGLPRDLDRPMKSLIEGGN